MPLVPIDVAEVDAEVERRSRGVELQDEAAELASDLRRFTQAAWPIVEPATVFKPNWHIDAIADHLEALRRREIRKLVINEPPRHMKSLNVSVLWPVWWWCSEPHVRFLTASYGADLATRDAVKSRRIIQSGWYRARWGNAYRLTSDQNVKTRYENDRTGYRIATSVGGGGTGEGGDVIIMDDPHKVEEIESDVQRQAVLDWHDGTISTRFNDPDTGIEVLVMQRLHQEDLTGHVLEQRGWTHLCLPAEYEPSHPFVWPDDPRTEPGELLWPDHFGPDAVAELKETLGSYRAAGQLQQRPAPAEGGLLKRHWWRFYNPANPIPTPDAVVQSWDTAFKDKTTSDYVVGQAWVLSGANRYLVRSVRGRWDLVETKTQLRALAAWVDERYPNIAHTILVENTANGPEIIAQLRDKITGLIPVKPDGDKAMRAHAASPQLEAGNVFVPGFASPDGSGPDTARTPAWVQDLIDECAAFDRGTNDDQVDAFTQAMIWARGRTRLKASTPDEERRDPGAITRGIINKDF
jgi:predicted phage terminase large subunit-like protein